MNTARLLEHRITRDLLQRRNCETASGNGRLVERIITVAAVTAGMLMLGSYAPELLWALLAGAGMLTLGTRVS
jgi:hypothetical protein